MKKYIGAIILGAVIMATGYLGVVFYKNIKVIRGHEQFLIQVKSWICANDPSACGVTPPQQ